MVGREERLRELAGRWPDPPAGGGRAPADPEEAGEAADRCGRSVARGALAGVGLELPNGDVEAVYYGAILGRVRYDRSRGVSFKFEDAEGVWEVTIAGHDLADLCRDLQLMRRETVRVGDRVSGIEVRAWQPPGRRG